MVLRGMLVTFNAIPETVYDLVLTRPEHRVRINILLLPHFVYRVVHLHPVRTPVRTHAYPPKAIHSIDYPVYKPDVGWIIARTLYNPVLIRSAHRVRISILPLTRFVYRVVHPHPVRTPVRTQADPPKAMLSMDYPVYKPDWNGIFTKSLI